MAGRLDQFFIRCFTISADHGERSGCVYTLGDLQRQTWPRFSTIEQIRNWLDFKAGPFETNARALAFLTEMSQAPQLADGTWLQLAICRSDQDTVIGDIGLHYIAQQHSLEIGYTLNSNYHGEGIAQRAVSLALLWTQTVHRYTDILAITDVRNVPSIKLLERLGFEQTTTETTDGVDEHHYRLAVRFRHNQIE